MLTHAWRVRGETAFMQPDSKHGTGQKCVWAIFLSLWFSRTRHHTPKTFETWSQFYLFLHYNVCFIECFERAHVGQQIRKQQQKTTFSRRNPANIYGVCVCFGNWPFCTSPFHSIFCFHVLDANIELFPNCQVKHPKTHVRRIGSRSRQQTTKFATKSYSWETISPPNTLQIDQCIIIFSENQSQRKCNSVCTTFILGTRHVEHVNGVHSRVPFGGNITSATAHKSATI